MKNSLTLNYNTLGITPNYITGLAQTDGSFCCSLKKSKSDRFGIQFVPEFNICSEISSKHVLDEIQLFFGCGRVTINIKNNSASFVVTKISDLYNIIIPHFLNYPVFCAKLHAFKLFHKIVNALFNKNMKTLEERRELLRMALSMNSTTNRNQDRIDSLWANLDIIETKDKYLINNNITTIDSIITDEFISGVIDGDGSFYISFEKNGSIIPYFTITNDLFSMPLLEKIKERFKDTGSISKITGKNALRYKIMSLKQIIEIIIPFMELNPLFSERAKHYNIFKEVCFLLNKEKPLTLETKLKIVELAYDAYKKGKKRELSKLDYINKYF